MISLIVNASCNSATSMSCGLIRDILYACLAASRVDVKPVLSSDSNLDRLAQVVFWPIPFIQMGLSVNFFAFSFEANMTAEEPEQTQEESSFFIGSDIFFEFMTSSRVILFLNNARGFFDEFMRFFTATEAICSSVVPNLRICERANNDAQ